MTEKLQKELNEQITAELWSANLYRSMAYYMQREGYEGFAHWMHKQAQEEIEHADKIADFMIMRQAIPKIDKIDVVPQSWGSPVEAFESAYKHEQHISQLFNLLVNTANEEKEPATQNFLWGFVKEQVEEEGTFLNIVEKLKKAGDAGILYLNTLLGER